MDYCATSVFSHGNNESSYVVMKHSSNMKQDQWYSSEWQRMLYQQFKPVPAK